VRMCYKNSPSELAKGVLLHFNTLFSTSNFPSFHIKPEANWR